LTIREQRRAALRVLVTTGSFRTLGEIRLQLAALHGFYVREPQLWKDLKAIGAERFVRWTINEGKADMSNPDSMNPMPLHDGDTPSFIAPDAIHPDVGGTLTRGAAPAAHPELAASHRDARLAKVADLAGESSVGHDTSATDTLAARAPEAFADSAKLLREKRN
jgi:hypothetical protein